MAARMRATGGSLSDPSKRRGGAAALAGPLSRSASPARTSGDPILDPRDPVAGPGDGTFRGGESGASGRVPSPAAWFSSARSHSRTKV